ncbi:MAG: hypothetical protein NC344_04230 [Bacteroidales bacterium]|nr:hypothetical protein [Bacteroidales bacterium]MCM1205831.1 hypothetical protein [Bacillota bacterium]
MELLKETKNRYKALDNVAGLMIVYMIFGHCIQACDVSTDVWWLSWMDYLFFFMPWFFFKAGMFYRQKELRTIISGGGKSTNQAVFALFFDWILRK